MQATVERKPRIWPVALRGVAAIVFGILVLAWPGVTVLALALLFGAFALVDGIAMLVVGIRRPGDTGRRVAYLVGGVIGIAAAVATVLWPGITALVLVVLIGAWAIVTGAFQIWVATRPEGHWLFALVGGLAIVAGLIMLLRPGVGAIAIALVIGWYAIIAGVVLLAEAWREYRASHAAPAAPAAPAGI